VYNNTQNETTKKHHFEQIMNITQRYDKTASTQNHKPKAILLQKSKVAQGSDKQNSTTNETNNRDKTFVIEEKFI
jgi:hypothetical protein